MESAISYKAVIEALLFVWEEPLRAEKIGEILNLSLPEVTGYIQELKEEMERQGRGVGIFKTGGGFQMGTRPEFAPYLEKLFPEDTARPLSNAAMESLTIVAYRQPITRMEIESLRGVKCDRILDSLLKRKLIRIVGRREGPGRPILYGTTPDFLKYFALNDLRELPPLKAGESINR